jgi:2-polyprenyl-3-methyl-5-hydroxy-6-metoxy-1,4-benzoquinol methylase
MQGDGPHVAAAGRCSLHPAGALRAGDLYDRIARPGPSEAFYRKLARDMGRGTRPVLELACGTGRLTIPIARDGHETVGLDTSPTMLEAARAKAESSGLGNTFVRGDMRAFALHRHFGLIVVSCNSLAHLTTNEDLRACLRRVRDQGRRMRSAISRRRSSEGQDTHRNR